VLAYQKKNIEFNKTFISPWVQLGNIFQQPDSAQKTLQALQRAAELGPENAQNWADLGDAFFKMGSYEEAVDAYGKTIKLDPSAAWPKSNLALTLATQGKYQEATQLYRESLEGLLDDRDKAVTWNHLGNAYRKLGDFENAVAAFLRADELNTKTSSYRDPMIESIEPDSVEEYPQGIPDPVADHVMQDSKSAANELAVKAKEEPKDMQSSSTNFPFDSEDQLEFVAISSDSEKSMYLEEGMETGILNTTDSGLEPNLAMKMESRQNMSMEGIVHPDTSGASLNEFLHQDLVSNPKALEEIAPDGAGFEYSMEPASQKAETEINLEKMDKSGTELYPVDFMEQSESKEPATNEQMINEIAYEEYLKDFVEPTRIIRDEPTELSPKSKPISETRASNDVKIQFDTQNANVWNELGNVYFNSGAYDDAIVAYRQAIELDPQFAWAYSNLALTYVQKGRFDEAILLYKHSIELFKNDKDKAITWNRLGNLYRRQQDYDNAIAAYQKADELDPDNISLSLRSRFSLLGNLLEEEPAYIS
jgi:tetratricopeptide (TPR) repeat protein